MAKHLFEVFLFFSPIVFAYIFGFYFAKIICKVFESRCKDDKQ